jgi:hypothetical protein
MNHSVLSKCIGDLWIANKLLKYRHLLLLAVVLVGLPLCALAQDATVVGTVTDPSGASVANVTITLTNAETNLVRTTLKPKPADSR